MYLCEYVMESHNISKQKQHFPLVQAMQNNDSLNIFVSSVDKRFGFFKNLETTRTLLVKLQKKLVKHLKRTRHFPNNICLSSILLVSNALHDMSAKIENKNKR